MRSRQYTPKRDIQKRGRKRAAPLRSQYKLRDVRTGNVIVVEMTPMQMIRKMDVFRRITHKGRLYQRVVDREASPRIRAAKRARWPYVSDAMGVHPKQIKAAREQLAKMGVNVSYTPDGGAIVESPLHRKRLAEAMGLHDRNGYGGRYDARHDP